MMYIKEQTIVGQTFTALDPNTEYSCIGYCCNDTFLVIGLYFDSVNNRTTIKTFKFSDVKFKGRLIPKV